MRASRLVALLLLLQARGRLTAAQLAAELEVSIRTVYRDLDALGEAGVPVYGAPGPDGGYRLVDGYRTRLTGLSQREAEALLVVDLQEPLRALGLGEDLLAGRLKLAAALPDALRAPVQTLVGRVHLDLPGWFETAESPPALPVLLDSVLTDHRVRFRYERDGRVGERTVDPLGLVLKGRRWYLVAHRDGRLRTYAATRIRDASATAEGFERPAGFDLAATWSEAVAQFEAGFGTVEVRVRATEAGHLRLGRQAGVRAPEGTATATDREPVGWQVLDVVFDQLEDAERVCVELGPEVEVLAPSDLRARIATRCAALAQLYAGP